LRIPVSLAWLLLLLTFFTAGLLRQFHAETPRAPNVHPVVGSLLFAAIFLLLLVAAREWRRGAVPGSGVRLGSVIPIMLMLLIEKWASLALYNPIFNWLNPATLDPVLEDARFRTFAGVALLSICLLIAGFSIPTARKTWRRVRPKRWPFAALATTIVVVGTYALLSLIAWLLGGELHLSWPPLDRALLWIVGGQAILVLSEEVYYRGLLLGEMERLAPRLGVRNATGRRWFALLPTSLLFGIEHLSLQAGWELIGRQLVFAVALGMLFGLLVIVSANLHVVAGIHLWINCLLLGAAPHFVDLDGRPALPSGTYIGLTLILAFVLAFLHLRVRHLHLRRRSRLAST
jgi:hypothetical protein